MTLDTLLNILYFAIAIIASVVTAGIVVTLAVGIGVGVSRALRKNKHDSDNR